MPGSGEEEFLRNTSILHFLPPKLLPLGVGGHEIYNLSPYPTDATSQSDSGDLKLMKMLPNLCKVIVII